MHLLFPFDGVDLLESRFINGHSNAVCCRAAPFSPAVVSAINKGTDAMEVSRGSLAGDRLAGLKRRVGVLIVLRSGLLVENQSPVAGHAKHVKLARVADAQFPAVTQQVLRIDQGLLDGVDRRTLSIRSIGVGRLFVHRLVSTARGGIAVGAGWGAAARH
jgi:hypothetical protein